MNVQHHWQGKRVERLGLIQEFRRVFLVHVNALVSVFFFFSESMLQWLQH